MIAASALLRHEATLRDAPDRDAFERVIVDVTPALIGADRLLVFRKRRGRWRLAAASHVAAIEPNAPAVRDLEAEVQEPVPVEGRLVLHPEDRAGRPLARIVAERCAPFDAGQRALADRLCDAWAQGYLSHGVRAARGPITRAVPVAAAILVIALSMIKVPLTALAPFEIVARDPVVVRAPMDGVVESLEVRADQRIARGATVAAFDARDLKAELALAEKRLDLAETLLETSRKDAFRTGGNGSQVILARAERSLALAERNSRAERFRATVLVAPADGIVLHEGRQVWRGRPVRTGEKIVEIADPARVDARIELAVSDALVLREGSRVRLFPDGTVAEHEARLVRASYLPQPTPDGRLVYPLEARPTEPLRIGARGTARVEGPRVRLWYRLLRRPLTALRQRIGL